MYRRLKEETEKTEKVGGKRRNKNKKGIPERRKKTLRKKKMHGEMT